MEEIFSIGLDLDPLSYNKQYISRFVSKKWTYQAKEFVTYKETIKEAIAEYIHLNKTGFPTLEKDQYLHLHLEYFIDAFFKNKKPRTKDNSNFIKPVEDAVKDAVGIDDSYNFELTTMKLDTVIHGLVHPVIYIELNVKTYDEIAATSKFLKKRGIK